jgi:predicted ATP-grasp superfamily ATP-dependent carboligase
LPFIYRGNIAAVSVPERAGESLEFFGSQVAKQTELRGLWQADFQLDSEGQLWLLEINPRWSASMELHETLQGYSWMKKHLEILQSPHAVLDNANEYRKAADGQIAKGIVYAPRDLVASAEQIRRLWQNRWEGTLGELQDSAFRVADIPEPIPTGLAIPEGTPIATVLCSSGQTEVSEAVLLGKIQHARRVLLDWLKIV